MRVEIIEKRGGGLGFVCGFEIPEFCVCVCVEKGNCLGGRLRPVVPEE
jgi:hypothetical protein